jgi:SulP family sulfate permease
MAELDLFTAALGVAGIVLIVLSRAPLVNLLSGLGLPRGGAQLLSRAGPLAVIALLTLTVASLDLHRQDVAIVGTIPAGFPDLLWISCSRSVSPRCYLPPS